jgi:P-type Cu+ transporter
MDALVSLGASAACLHSLWTWAAEGAAATGHLYFEAAAVIVALVLLGKTLESRAKRSAVTALRELTALRPERARGLVGREAERPVGEVAIGDMVLDRPGERVPVDGTVIRGETELDESLLTGEPMPVPRRVGDAVPADALNGAGLIRVRAERVGADTSLVAHAQAGKAPAQRLVDRVSAVLVPAVLVLSALTFAGWMLASGHLETAFRAAFSVLVIACPCALGLATPAALVAGAGVAARARILTSDIETLERATRLDVVAFDKTGAVTAGAPELVGIAAEGVGEDAPWSRRPRPAACRSACRRRSARPRERAFRRSSMGPMSESARCRSSPAKVWATGRRLPAKVARGITRRSQKSCRGAIPARSSVATRQTAPTVRERTGLSRPASQGR